MITRERYAELLENVLEKYDRYRAMYPRGATIVFVVSPKILTAIKAYEAGNRDSIYDTYMEPYNMEQFLKLRGVDVHLVHTNDEEIFSPAFVWDDGAGEINLNHAGLIDGDYLIDEGRLYTYSDEQNSYRDTGMTVGGRGIAREVWDAPNHQWHWANAGGVYGGNIFADSISGGNLSGIDFSQIAPAILNMPITVDAMSATDLRGSDYSELYNRIFGGRRKKAASAEQELNPGNTKAIDEYLSSFAPKQMMREA